MQAEKLRKKMYGYLDVVRKEKGCAGTGLTKTVYLDVAQETARPYDWAEIEKNISREDYRLGDIHVLSRQIAVLAALAGSGRQKEYAGLVKKMMTVTCNELVVTDATKTGAGLDFAVKELMLAFHFLDQISSEQEKAGWLAALKKIDPYKNYMFAATNTKEAETKGFSNINVYNLAGEYLREARQLTDTAKYFNIHWPYQLTLFNSFGMYKDGGNPMLYDLTTRAQIGLMMHFGYKGAFAERIEAVLKKGSMVNLFTMSSLYQMAYGGRSNQYLFNECLMAAAFEYEANRYKTAGDLMLAGVYKRAAHLAVTSIYRWLKTTPPRSLKNFYGPETCHGTEVYGYYDKYMITAGSFVLMAYVIADDTIKETTEIPAEKGGYAVMLEEDFHRVFANCRGYSVEIDYKAQTEYDSTGLGRIHKTGFPSELGLSMPFTKGTGYRVREGVKQDDCAIGPGWYKNNEIVRLASLADGLKVETEIIEETEQRVEFKVVYAGPAFDKKGCAGVVEHYTLTEDGINIKSWLVNPEKNGMAFTVPLLKTNGIDTTEITYIDNTWRVRMGKYKYEVEIKNGTGKIVDTLANRNGEYFVGQVIEQDKTNRIELNLRFVMEN
jgi:hypothetical protein